MDSYITSDLLALDSLIALMMEAERTSETSVDIQLIPRQYIPEDSELQLRFVSCVLRMRVNVFPRGPVTLPAC
jgi:hypothetical protein